MTPAPTFTGSSAGAEVAAARELARKLLPRHREIGLGLLFSAAAFVIRDGRAPEERVVVEEARRRGRRVSAACEAHRRRCREHRSDPPGEGDAR